MPTIKQTKAGVNLPTTSFFKMAPGEMIAAIINEASVAIIRGSGFMFHLAVIFHLLPQN